MGFVQSCKTLACPIQNLLMDLVNYVEHEVSTENSLGHEESDRSAITPSSNVMAWAEVRLGVVSSREQSNTTIHSPRGHVINISEAMADMALTHDHAEAVVPWEKWTCNGMQS